MPQVVIQSIGALHGPAPEADLVIDMRRIYRNPHADPALRELTGLDDPVRRHVLATPGVLDLVQHTARTVAAVVTATGRPMTVITECAGGRHRSVTAAVELGRALSRLGIAVEVSHRDVDRPVVQRQSVA
jgi:RNase adaptor protein for sRNA GlmZ degradation